MKTGLILPKCGPGRAMCRHYSLNSVCFSSKCELQRILDFDNLAIMSSDNLNYFDQVDCIF